MYEKANVLCWKTGNYTDECVCELCLHNFECSGFDVHDEDDEN